MPAQQSSTIPAPSGVDPAAVERYTQELLARLGLGAGASNAEIERAHDQRVDFLTQAPPDLADWAKREIGLVDEAYTLLCDPHADIAAALRAASPVATEHTESADPQPSGPTSRTQEPLAQPARQPMARSTRTLLGVGLACLVAFGVYTMGSESAVPPISGTPTDASSVAATQLDQAKVAAAMTKISANPKDADALKELGDLYFQAGDYQTAAKWYQDLREVQPKNVNAMVALGASLFNAGDQAGAKKEWTAAVKAQPNNAEAHYDLGFLALSQDPADMKTAKSEWAKVLKIDPNSDLAKSVSTHLGSLTQSGNR
jgi:cytochrome c-type biogenesis protein CcmH/NrfG